jgi:hypothetical protein
MAGLPVASLTVTVAVKGTPAEGVEVPAENTNEAAAADDTEVDWLDVREAADTSVAVSDHDPGVRKVTGKALDPASEAWKV